jgi:hypothetical protein
MLFIAVYLPKTPAASNLAYLAAKVTGDRATNSVHEHAYNLLINDYNLFINQLRAILQPFLYP